MLYLDGFAGLIVIGVWIFCFIDVLLTPDTAVRNLPKLAWVFIVLLLPTLGSIAWLVAGRPWNRVASQVGATGAAGRGTDHDASTRYVPANPDDDEEFLAGLRKRAEEQRERAREIHREPDDKADPS